MLNCKAVEHEEKKMFQPLTNYAEFNLFDLKTVTHTPTAVTFVVSIYERADKGKNPPKKKFNSFSIGKGTVVLFSYYLNIRINIS